MAIPQAWHEWIERLMWIQSIGRRTRIWSKRHTRSEVVLEAADLWLCNTKLVDDVLIKFDAEAWSQWHRYIPIHQRRQVPNQLPHQRRRTQAILDEGILWTE